MTPSSTENSQFGHSKRRISYNTPKTESKLDKLKIYGDFPESHNLLSVKNAPVGVDQFFTQMN